MLLKKFIETINDHERPAEERRFLLVSTLAIIAVMIVFVIDLLLDENIGEILILGIASAVVPFIIFFSVHFHKVRLGEWLLISGIVFIILPITFFSGGGIYGGAVVWFSFTYLYIALVLRGRERVVMVVILTAEVVIEYYLASRQIFEVQPHSIRETYLDSMASVIVVGFVISFMVAFQNILYEKENEASSRQAKEIEELNQAQNRFFSSMSHEIRTPINTIIGLNEMILREDISEEVAQDAMNIQSASKMLLTTINDILDMSKIESGKMEIVPVVYHTGDMLSEIVGMVWLKAKEKGLEFHVDVDQTLPSQLFGDEVRIKQILVNILNNALKYTEKGSVSLFIQWRKGEGKRAVITYRVEDTGKGIKKENIPYLFSAFKRVDEESNRFIEGTGLGLSIVKQFTELMDGTITVNSVYTQGSTFLVEIPQEIADETEVGDLRIEARHSMSARKHYRQSFEAPEAKVLVVDDNDTNLLVSTKLLRDTRVRSFSAQSGEEALNLCLQEKFDVILMDHLMPKMDGIETYKKIRSQTGGLNRETPITVLTANAGSDMQALYNKTGFDGYLLKPVTGEQLEAELLRLLPGELVNLTSEIELSEMNMTHRGKKKAAILITTDSVADLPDSLVKHYGVAVMPYLVYTDEGCFMDGIETETDGILSYMEDPKKSVHSSPPSPKQFEEFFAGQLGNAQNIIHITMSGIVSEGYKNALEASGAFNNVHVVDSEHLSGGTGILVIEAARLARDEIRVDELISKLEAIKRKIRTSFIVDSSDYLYRGKRIGKITNSLARAFMVHPVLALRKGRMAVSRFYVGELNKAREKYIRSVLNVPGNIDRGMVFIEYCGMDPGSVEKIKEMVMKEMDFERVIVHQASPAIATNSGPETFGVIYEMKT